MSSLDSTIGQNIQRIRGTLTQEELAVRMRKLGHPWTKMTVYNIERGERQLRLAEASDLLKSLGRDPQTDMNKLLMNDLDAKVTGEISDLESTIQLLKLDCRSIIQGRINLRSYISSDYRQWKKESAELPSDEVIEGAKKVIEQTQADNIIEIVRNELSSTKPAALTAATEREDVDAGKSDTSVQIISREEMNSYINRLNKERRLFAGTSDDDSLRYKSKHRRKN